MYKKIILLGTLALILLGLLAASACSQATGGNSTSAKQILIKAQLNADTVSIPLSEVDKNINTRFLVNTTTSKLSFMAYNYDSQLYVRADICPPCGSESFTLKNGTLVCDRCGTVFNAKTGKGVSGPCIKFSKQAAPLEVKDGNIVMKGEELAVAYQNTLNPPK